MEEPKGWRELQRRAFAAKDAQELIQIVGEMNQLLTLHEKQVAQKDAHSSSRRQATQFDWTT
jgi:hypothetical protein